MLSRSQWASTVRGKLVISQEEDTARHRTVLVAKLEISAAEPKKRPVHPLYEPVLISCADEYVTITGMERLQTGPLNREQTFAQTWMLRPAPLEDLELAEREWKRLSQLVCDLQEKAGLPVVGPGLQDVSSG